MLGKSCTEGAEKLDDTISERSVQKIAPPSWKKKLGPLLAPSTNFATLLCYLEKILALPSDHRKNFAPQQTGAPLSVKRDSQVEQGFLV